MIKNKTKKTNRKKTAVKQKQYPAYLLGIALVVMLLGQSALMLNATPADWQSGLAMLDISDGVTAMVADAKTAFEPMQVAVTAVNEFYNQSAIAAIEVLDISDTKPMAVINGIGEFYTTASNQLAQVMDLSNYISPYQPQVAGASIWR